MCERVAECGAQGAGPGGASDVLQICEATELELIVIEEWLPHGSPAGVAGTTLS